MAMRNVLGALVVVILMKHTLAYATGKLTNRDSGKHKVEISDARTELANRVLERILDVSMEIFRDIGASSHEMEELRRKRNMITACYFQAVSCY